MKARIKTGKVFTGKLAKILVERGVAKETRERKKAENEDAPNGELISDQETKKPRGRKKKE